MDSNVYFFFGCILLLHFVSVLRACSCRPKLREEACNSDYVIIAKVLGEQLMSANGDVYHYSLDVVEVLKTSALYEESEKVIQIRLDGPCESRLATGHAYILAGHVGEYVDEGVSRKVLETEFCNYIDFVYLPQNVDVLTEIIEMIKNPPACLQSRATAKKVNKFRFRFNDPMKAFSKRRGWNHPFQN